jgi:hypothetical protein
MHPARPLTVAASAIEGKIAPYLPVKWRIMTPKEIRVISRTFGLIWYRSGTSHSEPERGISDGADHSF